MATSTQSCSTAAEPKSSKLQKVFDCRLKSDYSDSLDIITAITSITYYDDVELLSEFLARVHKRRHNKVLKFKDIEDSVERQTRREAKLLG